MKRVLIITYYWPPAGGGGVMRWLKMSKYLPEWGWQPVICTPENPDPSVIDESLLREVPPEAEILKVPIWELYDLYRRQDAIGTPYCITVDHQSPDDNTVTIRYRDTMEQERIPIDQIREIVAEKVNMKNLFVKIK